MADTNSLCESRYRTIVADPPWEHPGTGGLAAGWRKGWRVNREQPLAYSSMTLAELTALPVAALAFSDARLFLWATNTRMPDAYELLEAWGFAYRQTLVWRKPDANPVGGSVAPNAEFLLVGIRGTPGVLRRISSPVVEHPRGGLLHSQKPDVFLDLVEQISPGPYLEMFSRRARLGWQTWGDEALHGTEAVA